MIFYNDGPPIRFFVQRDGPTEERNAVEAIIKEEGGVLSDKVVKKGYIVLFMDTSEAKRIMDRWSDPEHPQRYFVASEWVRTCQAKKQLLRQVFVENGLRVKMCIHPTIANLTTREQLVTNITLHGGDPNVSQDEATIVIAARETSFFKEMRRLLQGKEDKFVEHFTWVDTCIEQGFYHHSPNPVKSFGGRRTGDERTPFNEEDETNICKYIASILPYKETGGRTGNRVYMELMDAAKKTPELQWAQRHTWQSWRERYKKNSERLDKHIAAIVNTTRANGGSYFMPSRDRNSQISFVVNGQGSPGIESSSPMESVASGSLLPVQETAASSTSEATGNEGWGMQETSDATPSYVKRKSSGDEDPDETSSQKRSKTDEPSFRTFVLTPSPAPPLSSSPLSFLTNTEFVADFQSSRAPWDQVEEEIKRIAHEFQFIVTEVQSYYERSGDIVATRQRFERLRGLINNYP